MKVHLEPKVILVTRPQIDWEGVDELLAEYGEDATWRMGENDTEGDLIPELFGRLCYSAYGDRQGRIGAKDYIENILSGGHGSVLAHAVWGFVIVHAGRGFTHQMVRHGTGTALSQESQHFIRYGVEGEKNAPEAAICLTGIPEELHEKFIADCETSIRSYEKLWKDIRAMLPADAKVKKVVSGAARGLLPNALESRLGFTANARALRHVCQLRGTEANTLEIRLVAVALTKIMLKEAAALFQDFSIGEGTDGYPVVLSKFQKV
jgi:thymidylate synthase (FAD)